MNLRNLFFRPRSTYTIINNPDKTDLKKRFSDSWKNPIVADKQYSLTLKQREKKVQIPAVEVLISDLRRVSRLRDRVLEVGCSTGYHDDYIREAGIKVSYFGCDYSPAFIKLAKKIHPGVPFKVADATKLSYKTGEFDIVISGCCILHIFDYEKAIAEVARVAKKYVIFHRTPVIHLRETMYASKTAYNTPMVEIFFNEEELTSLFGKYGLKVIKIQTTGKFEVPKLNEQIFMKNYLCEK